MAMNDYFDRIKPLHLARDRIHHLLSIADDLECSEYRSLAGTLLYLCKGILLQASMVASNIQQKLDRLTVKQLIYSKKMFNDIRLLRAFVTFRRPEMFSSVSVATLFDSSHGGNKMVHGRTGLIFGRRIESRIS